MEVEKQSNHTTPGVRRGEICALQVALLRLEWQQGNVTGQQLEPLAINRAKGSCHSSRGSQLPCVAVPGTLWL